MNRLFSEKLKFVEGQRIPLIGGLWYNFLVKLDNNSISKEILVEDPLNHDHRLTSYPARIGFVSMAIKSLMLQSYKPDRILLWLAEEQFPRHELPLDLLALESKGLEILWMHDLYGHKKYYYPVKNQAPNEIVISFDDDIIYSPQSIERLMKTHLQFPRVLVCERGQVFNIKNKDNPGRWDTISDIGISEPTFSMNPSPGGGCLIPYGAFHKDAVNESLIRDLAFKNDDLWYMFMCAENGTRMVKTRKNHKPFSVISGSQIEQMANDNVVNNHNSIILRRLIDYYPEAWRRIQNDSY